MYFGIEILGSFFKAIFGIWTDEAKERRRRRKEKRAAKKEAERRKRIDADKAEVLALRRKLMEAKDEADLKKRKEEFADHWKATYKPEELPPNPYEDDKDN